jgi:hypothetical protein
LVLPVVGDQDVFEGIYTEKFRALACAHGEFVRYERDKGAAIDLGVHLTEPDRRGRRFSRSRVWFQLKGVMASTLSHEEYTQAPTIGLPVKLHQLRFWFASPEPIYLVVYVESADIFLIEDVQEIVYRQWGEALLAENAFPDDQKEVTVRLSKDAVLMPSTWESMRRHRSMRIDGPLFRGRPLGHRLDPLRCWLNRLEPVGFCELVARLLDVHGYSVIEELDPALLFPKSDIADQYAVLTRGRLYYTLEWVPQLTTEVGLGPDDDFRVEGTPLHAQGSCAVFVHGNPRSHPNRTALAEFARHLAKRGIRQLLVFANLHDYSYFGAFFSAVRDTGLACTPQLLPEIAYNLLIATVVYLEFRHVVSWKTVNYL